MIFMHAHWCTDAIQALVGCQLTLQHSQSSSLLIHFFTKLLFAVAQLKTFCWHVCIIAWGSVSWNSWICVNSWNDVPFLQMFYHFNGVLVSFDQKAETIIISHQPKALVLTHLSLSRIAHSTIKLPVCRIVGSMPTLLWWWNLGCCAQHFL